MAVAARATIGAGGGRVDEPESTAAEGGRLVAAIVDCAPHEPLLEIFEHVLNQLYEGDLLPQEAILGWADTAGESDEGSDERKCLAKANNMITWLREDDDDDDDDEEDD